MINEIPTRDTELIERKGMGYTPVLTISIADLFADFKEDHKKYKLLVEEVIDGWSPASNNDFLLYIEVLRMLDLCEVTSSKENIILKFKKDNIKFVPSSESITRARRSLNEVGKCLATEPRVLEMRKKREIAVRRYFAGEEQ